MIREDVIVKEPKDTLPNYQDLKKPNSHQNKSVHPPVTQPNKKYEYYEDVSNRETLKANDKFGARYQE